ncbi:MAG: PQQ-like beta-propeller repeat protein [Acidobacteriia bacterium]|nr:PQQ-like beta-propeller repeat protein [Terriglobia bacterium]
MRGGARWRGWRIAAACLYVSVAMAQTLPPTPETPNDYPTALPPRKGPAPPTMIFKLLVEVPLPATPTGRALTLDQGWLGVPVDGGTARVDLSEPAAAILADEAPAGGEAPSGWVLSPDGRHRVRTLPAGQVECEKLGAMRRRWKTTWSLRVPGATLAPAILSAQRVIFGSADNQVYCVRRKNGHRLWAADLEDRISSPLAAWRGVVMPAPPPKGKSTPVNVEMVLVVPDGGASLIGLDVYDGSRLATFEVPSDKGMLATAPLVLPDGRIAVARKGYASGGAALLLVQPVVSEAATKTGPK